MDRTEQKSFSAYSELSASHEFSASSSPSSRRADLSECQSWLPVRKAQSHKGSNGSVLIVGGGSAMAGAACLAGWSAYIAGAGLVRVASIPDNTAIITACRPELLVSGIQSMRQLKALLQQSDVLALGPGLGQGSWSQSVFETCLESGPPHIIDADGLNLLAKNPQFVKSWILTPHAGEAARLLQCTADDIQADRPAAVREIVRRYGGICILKGPDTLIATGAEDKAVWHCPYGNEVLAVAGTGDVLTGLLAGLLAQSMSAGRAAVAAAVLHASAGDMYAARHGAIGMLASDLMLPLRRLRNAHQVKHEE